MKTVPTPVDTKPARRHLTVVEPCGPVAHGDGCQRCGHTGGRLVHTIDRFGRHVVAHTVCIATPALAVAA